jgi:hypothetical protein
LYKTYGNQVEFLLVYIREAHPDSILPTLQDGKEVFAKIEQTKTLEQRAEVARQCTAVLHLSMPTVVDKPDNQVNAAYAGWPDRLYIVGKDGEIGYKGGPGPAGFKVNDIERWLKENIK